MPPSPARARTGYAPPSPARAPNRLRAAQSRADSGPTARRPVPHGLRTDCAPPSPAPAPNRLRAAQPRAGSEPTARRPAPHGLRTGYAPPSPARAPDRCAPPGPGLGLTGPSERLRHPWPPAGRLRMVIAGAVAGCPHQRAVHSPAAGGRIFARYCLRAGPPGRAGTGKLPCRPGPHRFGHHDQRRLRAAGTDPPVPAGLCRCLKTGQTPVRASRERERVTGRAPSGPRGEPDHGTGRAAGAKGVPETGFSGG
ncbi:hypothetical protein BJY16_000029 [Actinoplanes octamycinicus]|uniref:Uncharacterized protein n=1 Tax=Actinoplanes octamycinicus TaxID=135948 RepID=A0A7W7GQV8_9ACTN|nr:hypothetical protein [Actinoplanes octamycinicus]